MTYQLIHLPSRKPVQIGDELTAKVTGASYTFLSVNEDADGLYIKVKRGRDELAFSPGHMADTQVVGGA
jgi:hypothetical protein